MTRLNRQQLTAEEEKVISKYVYKYLDFKAAVGARELCNIDLIKNKLKKETLCSYIGGLRTYLDTGRELSNTPRFLLVEGMKLKNKHYPRLTPSSKDRYVMTKRNISFNNMPKVTINAEPKVEVEQQPQMSETTQKISAIKCKLDTKLREYDLKASQYRKILENIEHEKQCAKAKVLDDVLGILDLLK